MAGRLQNQAGKSMQRRVITGFFIVLAFGGGLTVGCFLPLAAQADFALPGSEICAPALGIENRLFSPTREPPISSSGRSAKPGRRSR